MDLLDMCNWNSCNNKSGCRDSRRCSDAVGSQGDGTMACYAAKEVVLSLRLHYQGGRRHEIRTSVPYSRPGVIFFFKLLVTKAREVRVCPIEYVCDLVVCVVFSVIGMSVMG